MVVRLMTHYTFATGTMRIPAAAGMQRCADVVVQAILPQAKSS